MLSKVMFDEKKEEEEVRSEKTKTKNVNTEVGDNSMKGLRGK